MAVIAGSVAGAVQLVPRKRRETRPIRHIGTKNEAVWPLGTYRTIPQQFADEPVPWQPAVQGHGDGRSDVIRDDEGMCMALAILCGMVGGTMSYAGGEGRLDRLGQNNPLFCQCVGYNDSEPEEPDLPEPLPPSRDPSNCDCDVPCEWMMQACRLECRYGEDC